MKRFLLGACLLAAAGCGDKGGGGPAAPQSGFGAFAGANLIIVSLDTLRADATSMGGGADAAELTPTLAALAKESVLFEHARSQAPHTAPSHMTLFTSTLPSVHDVQNVSFDQVLAPGQKKEAIIKPARTDIPVLAEVLKSRGFHTVGLTDGGNLNPPHGFDRGFDTYTYDLEGVEAKAQLGVKWVGQLAAEPQKPFFLFWHTYQIHAPYCPPPSYVEQWAPKSYQGFMRERIESMEGKTFRERWAAKAQVFWKDRELFGQPEADFLHGVYRGGVRYTDDELVALIQSLRESGLLDKSILVVTSDHGEEFHEHGRWQHEALFEECLRVPLLVRLPGGRNGGTRLRTPVALIDVMPTVLDLLGVDAAKLTGLPGPVRREGVSLADSVVFAREPKARPIISELIADRGKGGDFERQVAIYANGMTFLYDKVRGHRDAVNPKKIIFERHLYDLTKDPKQEHDLAPAGGGIVDSFMKLLSEHDASVARQITGAVDRPYAEVSDEASAQLGDLGYAEDPEDKPTTSTLLFEVVLQSVDAAHKGAVGRVLLQHAGLDEATAREAVETPPTVVKSRATRGEAEELKRLLEAAGATVEIN